MMVNESMASPTWALPKTDLLPVASVVVGQVPQHHLPCPAETRGASDVAAGGHVEDS